ncbi:hypothetical protein DFJ74DRAFT_458969 [Hyaloraphidium curvatum]|nr:hypothetical protein DFJ74DRAFT_458969 [Hyaloraphidium curvatum]
MGAETHGCPFCPPSTALTTTAHPPLPSKHTKWTLPRPPRPASRPSPRPTRRPSAPSSPSPSAPRLPCYSSSAPHSTCGCARAASASTPRRSDTPPRSRGRSPSPGSPAANPSWTISTPASRRWTPSRPTPAAHPRATARSSQRRTTATPAGCPCSARATRWTSSPRRSRAMPAWCGGRTIGGSWCHRRCCRSSLAGATRSRRRRRRRRGAPPSDVSRAGMSMMLACCFPQCPLVHLLLPLPSLAVHGRHASPRNLARRIRLDPQPHLRASCWIAGVKRRPCSLW